MELFLELYKTSVIMADDLYYWEYCKIPKDAGFVYESFRIDTKQTFLTFFSYETNPRNESFENCVTKRIH